MGIRKLHDHPGGKVCYRLTGTHDRPTRDHVLVKIDGREFAAEYMGYSGSWYLYDAETGREVGSLRPEFFEVVVRPHAIPLVPDPDCLVVAKT